MSDFIVTLLTSIILVYYSTMNQGKKGLLRHLWRWEQERDMSLLTTLRRAYQRIYLCSSKTYSISQHF
jgi:hypothetical protein